MIDFSKELNTEQLEVVLHGEGPCLVLAGAGSGKTRTIVYRVAYLLEQGIDPQNILLVTFTNKAAREMIDRVALITHGETRLPWSGTFHHIAYRILHQYAALLGYHNNFTVLDSEDSLDLMKLCMKQEGIERKDRRFPSPAVVHSMVSYARNAERTIEDVLDGEHPQWLDLAETLGRIAEEYRKRKREANVMDFDDLLVGLHALLSKSEPVRKKLSAQFQYILVDEYQDTNKIQASIIRLLASTHRNVLVVGDDAQSIYSFRAADIQNILQFEKEYPEAKIFRLETNYRSTPDILAVANDVIAKNRAQYQKELKSVIDMFVKPELHAFAESSEEAQFIAERILELREEGVPLNRMSVLFRAAFHSQALEMELVRRDIPYEYRGGIRFFERAHVKDVLAYLRVVSNKDDQVAWSRVLNMQAGIGPVAAELIMKTLNHENIKTLEDISDILPSRATVGWNDFLQVWRKISESDGTPAGLINAVLDSKYIDYLEQEYPDYRERIEDIKQLGFFAEKQKDLSLFLAEASMQESYNAAQVRSAQFDDGEKLILSTVHQAKGLEWDAVFIINLAAGQFPNERAMKEDNGVEEERRLLYVAITRAKKYLYLSYPLMGNISSYLQGPSMFVEEIDRDLIDEQTLGGGTVFDSDEIEYVDEELPFDTKPRKGFLIDV